MLIGYCFIPDGKDESDAEGWHEDGHPAGDTLRKSATIPNIVGQKREAAEGIGDGREVARVLTHKTTSQDGGRGTTCTIDIQEEGGQHQAHCRQKAPCKEFKKGGLKRPRGTSQGQWLSDSYVGFSRLWNSSSTSNLLCTWCAKLHKHMGYMTFTSRFMPSRYCRRPWNTTWHACLMMPTCVLSMLSVWL